MLLRLFSLVLFREVLYTTSKLLDDWSNFLEDLGLRADKTFCRTVM